MRLWHCAAATALISVGLVAACDEVNVKPSEFPASWWARLDGGHGTDGGARPDSGTGLDASAPAWQKVEPEVITSYVLNAVAGTGAATFAVGKSAGEGVILSFESSAWKVTSAVPASIPKSVEWKAMSFEVAVKAWVVGTGGAVLSWDNGTFTDRSLTGATPSLNAVLAQNSQVLAAGPSGGLWLWDGVQWKDRSPTGAGATNGLWGDGTNAWAACSDGLYRVADPTWGFVYAGNFAAIHGAGQVAWAVGDGLVVRFDTAGNSKTVLTPSGTSTLWRAVWVNAADDVWIASARNVIQHWGGSGWTQIVGYDSATPGDNLYGLSVAPSGTWAVGDQLILQLQQ